jgi:hypothetical protein
VKNSLKFISIGLVMVVLLMSQWAIDRPAEAAAVAEDKVEWRDSSDAAVSYYSTGGATSTATFYIKDGALETTPAASETWSSITTSIADAATLTLGTGAISGGGAATAVTVDVSAAFIPGTSALSAAPSLTVNSNVVTLDQYNLTAGTFSLGDASGTTGSVVADFNYHTIDSYDGATAGQKIAKVTSTSDSTGTWVAISEVATSGSATASYTADFYKGSVVLSRNAGDAETAGSVFVADGDTVTVTYYGCGTSCTDTTDSSTSIATATAIIDDTDPTITVTSSDAADGTLTKDTTPTLSFTVTDGASGFVATAPLTYVTTLVNGCKVLATENLYGALSSSELNITINTGLSSTWATANVGTCNGAGGRTAGGFGINTTNATTTPTSTSHGNVFSYSITATDKAGNSVTLDGTDANITVDTVVPNMGDATAGKGWTTKEVSQKNSVKVEFDESLAQSSVSTDDFTVDGTAPTSIVFGGTTATIDKVIYLVMESDLAPNATPDVRLVGSVTDLAGNELKDSDSNTNCTTAPCGYADRDSEAADGVNPTVSGVAVDSNLLAAKGTATLTFDSDEAMKDNGAAISAGCTCVLVSGGGAAGNPVSTKLTVTMPTSVTAGTAAFKQASYSTTGIYALIVQAVDVKDNEGNAGGVQVENENVSSQITANLANVSATAVIKLKKWPLADHDGDGSLSDSITASINGGDAIAVTIATGGVNWGTAETVTLAFTGAATAVLAADTVKLSYYYADATHTVEVDVTAPTVTSKSPDDGSSTENTTPFISVTWSDDEYAGDTNTTVTITKAEITDPDGTTVDISGSLSSTDNKSFFYRPAGLAIGEHTVKFSAEDAAGNEKKDQSWKFSVTEKAQTSVALLPGWNLVSLPGTPSDTAINSVITSTQVDTVVTYDPAVPGGWLTAVRADGVLSGTLATVDAQRGYWVHTANDDPIKVDIPGYTAGSQQLPPAIALVKGWNLVPAVSIEGAASMDADIYFTGLSWTRGYGFSTSGDSFASFIPDTDNDAEANIVIGKGYWVFLTKAGDLVP